MTFFSAGMNKGEKVFFVCDIEWWTRGCGNGGKNVSRVSIILINLLEKCEIYNWFLMIEWLN